MEELAGIGLVGLMLVETLGESYRSKRNPPVTLALIASNTAIYLRPKHLDSILPTLDRVSFNPDLILKHKDIKRFLLSAFYHFDEDHLFSNMLSLLSDGIRLETKMGSLEFASMVAALLGMSHGISLLLAKGLLFFDYETAYYDDYSVGFSGVLFAMKVVLYNSHSGDANNNYVFPPGVVVPSRYAAWAELFFVQMYVPEASFLGHLGGVLAGSLYVYLKRDSSRYFSAVKPLMKTIGGLLCWPFRFAQQRVFGRGTVGGNESGVWRRRAFTYDNVGLLVACEVCRDDETISLEELRQGRVQRLLTFCLEKIQI